MTQRSDPGTQAGGHRERRDYFRITDHIGLEVQPLPEGAPDDFSAFGTDPLGNLQAEFKRLDHDIRTQLVSLSERDRGLQSVLKAFNAKLDVLARIMAFEQNPLQPEHWRQTTLSEGGVAFISTNNRYQVGDQVALRMTLPPDMFQPRAVGEVVALSTEECGSTRVHTQFVRMEDSDRQQLVRHIMRWQIRQRQQLDPHSQNAPGQRAD